MSRGVAAELIQVLNPKINRRRLKPLFIASWIRIANNDAGNDPAAVRATVSQVHGCASPCTVNTETTAAASNPALRQYFGRSRSGISKSNREEARCSAACTLS